MVVTRHFSLLVSYYLSSYRPIGLLYTAPVNTGNCLCLSKSSQVKSSQVAFNKKTSDNRTSKHANS